MYICIELKKDVEMGEGVMVARAIIDALDDANKIPDQITGIAVSDERNIWISEEAAAAEAERPQYVVLDDILNRVLDLIDADALEQCTARDLAVVAGIIVQMKKANA